MTPPSTPSRPRVLILSAYYFPFQGGIETHARSLAGYLARHGTPVIVVTRRADREALAVDTVDGVPVHRVRPAGPRTGLRKWAMLVPAAIAMFRLRRQFDVIYCPGYQGIGLAAIFVGRLLGRPVILRSGNVDVLRGGNWDAPLARWHIPPRVWPIRWLKSVVRRAYLLASAFVCNSRAIEAEALECGVARERVHYLPNAVDASRFRPPIADERRRIRSAARRE